MFKSSAQVPFLEHEAFPKSLYSGLKSEEILMGFSGGLVYPAEEKSGIKPCGKEKDWARCTAWDCFAGSNLSC